MPCAPRMGFLLAMLILPPGKLIDKLKTPESTLAEITAINEPESAVNSAVIAIENCCTRPKTLSVL